MDRSTLDMCTEKVRRVIFTALDEAASRNSREAGPEHLLYGLLRETRGNAVAILDYLDIRRGTAWSRLQTLIRRQEGPATEPTLSAAAERVIALSQEEAHRLGIPSLGTEHLLLGLLHPESEATAGLVDDAFLARFRADDPANDRFFAAGREGHHRFDLEAYVAHRLAAAGVGRVEALGLDTYADASRFYSFRRATHRGAADYGRQISIIGV